MLRAFLSGSLSDMIRWLLLLPLLALFVGCRATPEPVADPSNHGAVLNAWFTQLDEVNFALHDTLLKALFVSRRSGKEVFVRRITVEGASEDSLKHYKVSTERGGADNVVGVNWATCEFRLDHYLPTDGPTINQIRQRLKNQFRIRELKKELGVFDIR